MLDFFFRKVLIFNFNVHLTIQYIVAIPTRSNIYTYIGVLMVLKNLTPEIFGVARVLFWVADLIVYFVQGCTSCFIICWGIFWCLKLVFISSKIVGSYEREVDDVSPYHMSYMKSDGVSVGVVIVSCVEKFVV